MAYYYYYDEFYDPERGWFSQRRVVYEPLRIERFERRRDIDYTVGFKRVTFAQKKKKRRVKQKRRKRRAKNKRRRKRRQWGEIRL